MNIYTQEDLDYLLESTGMSLESIKRILSEMNMQEEGCPEVKKDNNKEVVENTVSQTKSCLIEIYSRVTGFFRPVQVWNKGKQAEFKDRKTFKKDFK